MLQREPFPQHFAGAARLREVPTSQRSSLFQISFGEFLVTEPPRYVAAHSCCLAETAQEVKTTAGDLVRTARAPSSLLSCEKNERYGQAHGAIENIWENV